MKPKCQVRWYNGLFLSPQHFQQGDRYQTAVLEHLLQLKTSTAWGLTALEVNQTALAEGILKLESCQAVLPPPHCTLIDLPEVDPLPLERRIDLKEDVANVYLTVPIARENKRYLESDQSLTDDYDPSFAQTVGMLKKHFSLTVGSESRQGLESIQIGEIERGPQKTFRWRMQRFIPTCLTLAASPVLLDVCRRLVNDIEAKAREARHAGRKALSEESLHLLMLNQHIPVLRHHLYQVPDSTHPSVLFAELSRLGGVLKTFDSGDTRLPAYKHEDLTNCFHDLVTEVGRMVGRPFRDEQDYVELSRWHNRPNIWEGSLSMLRPREDGTYVLAFIGGGIDINKFALEMPRFSKISYDGRNASRLGATNILAVPIEYQAAPPAPVEAKPNSVYFRLVTNGPDWKRICEEQKIGIWIDNEFVAGDKIPTVLVYSVRSPRRP